MMNLADDFCDRYDELDEAVLVNSGATWRRQPRVIRKGQAICAAVLDNKPIRWPATTDSVEGQRQLYATLKGLDWAFQRLNPRWTGKQAPRGLSDCKRCFRNHARFSSRDPAK